MRKQNKIIIWPLYFDVTKTRNEGRRVSKTLAVSSPKISELKDAAEKAGLKFEVVADASHPKMPWLKVGMLLVEKNGSKEDAIRKIAKQLLKIRSAASPRDAP
ncbi:MAG: signal recognition particle subunit SRP19/SEC65 family protein [Candidatus Bathyarchaeia archaeon]